MHQTDTVSSRGALTKQDVLRAVANETNLTDGYGTGLLLVANRGPAHWVFRWTEGGKQPQMRLGYVERDGLWDPAEARKLRDAQRAKLSEGVSLQAEKKIVARQIDLTQSFGAFAEKNRLRIGPAKEPGNGVWVRDCTLKVGALARMRPADITVQDVADAMQPYWPHMQPTANRLRQRIEGVLNAAWADGLIPTGRDWSNPALKRGPLQHKLKKVKKRKVQHFESMPYPELPAFLVKLRAKTTVSAACLEWSILAGGRIGESCLATWAEIDLKKMIWVVPPTHLKSRDDEEGQTHIVPITRAMLKVLLAVRPRHRSPQPGEFIFPNARNRKKGCYCANSIWQLVSHFNLPPTINGKQPTVHGFRTSFAEWAQEQGYNRDLIDYALSHEVGDDTSSAYQRSKVLNLRRPMMAAWADYCAAPVKAKPDLRLVA